MNVTVQGKQISVGDALKTHVSEKLEDLNSKYFNRAIDGTVTFSREGHAFFRTHIALRIGKDIMVQSQATEEDPYLAFDVATGKLARQMRRYKTRLREHHEQVERADKQQAMGYVLAPVPENDNEVVSDEPAVIAEMSMPIQTLAVADAVMLMDLSGQSALMFRNASHSRLNMVYRRPDGNIGWVDPSEG